MVKLQLSAPVSPSCGAGEICLRKNRRLDGQYEKVGYEVAIDVFSPSYGGEWEYSNFHLTQDEALLLAKTLAEFASKPWEGYETLPPNQG